jgi:hypothetical protein
MVGHTTLARKTSLDLMILLLEKGKGGEGFPDKKKKGEEILASQDFSGT